LRLSRPAYFTRVQDDARRRWDQLEADPVLAGPWHQLFRQVQSPRHVLSELLQNADDAKATWVQATISDGLFEFVHNGEDFDEESLQSICQFGLSNKRHLHTIGFRGVGFKSAFALGPQVEIITPSLTYGFHHKRFTEPIWLAQQTSSGETIIRVAIDQASKITTLRAEFDRWVRSPIPLLFFHHIKRLEIQNHAIRREVLGPGPMPKAEYIRLSNGKTIDVLVVHSDPEAFPQEVMEEIRDERGSMELDLPPCAVQIVLSEAAEHFLYTVLPTEVKPLLPFSFNGPFMQDPARREIKHPVNSPTNRWLLQRIGQLASNAMRGWLDNQDIDVKERARAYELLPRHSEKEDTLDDVCTNLVIEEFKKSFSSHEKILLGHDGSLLSKDNVVALPKAITQTWPPEQALNIFAPHRKKVLSQDIRKRSFDSLKSWNVLDELDIKDIVGKLLSMTEAGPFCPKPLERLFHLWAYLQPLSSPDSRELKKIIRKLPIVPVSGKKELLPAEDVLVLGGREWEVSDENKDFLMSRVDVADPAWVKLMTNVDEEKIEKHHALACDFFNKLNLYQRVGVEQVVAAAAKKIFNSSNDLDEEGIRLARIAAFSDVRIQDDFKFLCQDGQWRTTTSELLVQGSEDLEALLPWDIFSIKVISDDYEKGLPSKDIERWRTWAGDFLKSKLLCFPVPLLSKETVQKNHSDISKLCISRGGNAPSSYPLKSHYFQIHDYNWDENIWFEWQDMEEDRPGFLSEVLRAILQNWSEIWEKRVGAKVFQEGHTYIRTLDHGNLRAAWLQKLRNLSCLPDTFDNCYLPAELYRRTLDTEALLNIEKFVHHDFDKPQYSKILDLLGVQSQPTGVDPLLTRLKDLSKTKTPPITHLVDLYRAIDRVLLRMDTRETAKLKRSFNENALIYTDGHDWEKLNTVFRDNPEDIPGVRLIHPEAANLAMWDRFEVPRRPTLGMAIAWLKSKPLDQSLNKPDRERAIEILRRAPAQTWQECQAWLDVTGRWVSKSDLKWYTNNIQTISGLFSPFKRRTADLSILDGTANIDFIRDAGLNALDNLIEHRLESRVFANHVSKPSWLLRLADILLRLRRPDDNETSENLKVVYESERSLASRLKKVKWQPVHNLKVIPYINSEQAGSPSERKVIWQDDSIYVQGSPPAHHPELINELSRHFQTHDVKKIIADCVDRDPEWIDVYADEHLDLEDLPSEETSVSKPPEEDKKIATEPPVTVETPPEKILDNGKEHEQHKDNEDEDDKGEDKLRTKSPITSPDSVKKGFKSFLDKLGFTWVPQHEYFADNNGTIIRKTEPPFKWAEYNVSGERIGSYWVGRGSLENGVEIPADIWNQILTDNQQIFIILIDSPSVSRYKLSDLKDMVNLGKIEIYPTRMIIRTRDQIE